MAAKMSMITNRRRRARGTPPLALALALAGGICAVPLAAQAPPAPQDEVAPPVATYADLVDLAQKSAIVATVEITDQRLVEPERAPGLAPGHARLYLEAGIQGLLIGPSALGVNQVFLADVPVDARGRPPRMRKEHFLVFANPVAGRPGSLQLVEPDAMFAADPRLEQRTRGVIAEVASREAPPRITGVREAFSMAGNLAGESETQLFLDTASGAPVSLSVIRRPGMEPQWGVSWSEIVDQSAAAPQRDTLEWYRLACSLPGQLPAEANNQDDRAGRIQAEADYQHILAQLGPCERVRG